MFANRMKLYKVQKPQITTDEFNFESKSYVDDGEILAAIVQTSATKYAANAFDLELCELVGFTNDSRNLKGYKIGNYKVKDVVPHKSQQILFLVSLGDDSNE